MTCQYLNGARDMAGQKSGDQNSRSRSAEKKDDKNIENISVIPAGIRNIRQTPHQNTEPGQRTAAQLIGMSVVDKPAPRGLKQSPMLYGLILLHGKRHQNAASGLVNDKFFPDI